MSAIWLINRHGRRVDVEASRKTYLLRQGYRERPESSKPDAPASRNEPDEWADIQAALDADNFNAMKSLLARLSTESTHGLRKDDVRARLMDLMR